MNHALLQVSLDRLWRRGEGRGMAEDVGMEDAKQGFFALVKRAEAGEVIYLTRHRRRIAAIVPVDRIKHSEDHFERLLRAMPDIAKAVNEFDSPAAQRAAFTALIEPFGLAWRADAEDV